MKDKPTTIICAADQVAVEGVPEEIKILPLGTVHNVHQDFLVDEESCQAIINQFKNRKIDLVIDYEHQTLLNVQAPAGGWIKEIRKGKDALIAKVEWTPKAQEYLRNKEYRYLSPVVNVRKSDGRAVSISSVALTNIPAITGMFAVVNSAGAPAGYIEEPEGGKEMEFLQMLAAMLGLPETATEEDIKNAVEALQKKGTETEPVANSTILSMLSLKADAKTEDVTAKIQQLQNGGTGMAAELADLKKRFAKREAEDAVTVALKDGKISAAQKEWAAEYALKDPTGFQSFCEKATPVVPMGKTATTDPKVSGGKTEIDTVVLKNLGLTKEDLEKYADKEA
nr:MAG TPA: hypothetical protein [Caudoviricetes sp.]